MSVTNVENPTGKIDDPEYILESEVATGKAIRVLDNGYVRLVDSMGTDLSVVNAARASYAKESHDLNSNDIRLIKFLVREGHHSPFRHAFVSFELKAPLMVARQHWKYVVGSDHTMDGWNEASRRYITMEPEFYIPGHKDWRSKPDNSKQGSGGPIDPFTGGLFTSRLVDYIDQGITNYEMAIGSGVAPEMARLFLPAYGMYTIYRWSASLQSVVHFLNQRVAEDAQLEIQNYAKAVLRLTRPLFPVTIDAMLVED